MPTEKLAALNERRRAKNTSAASNAQPTKVTKLKPTVAPAPEPLLVKPLEAARLIGVGKNVLYQLLAQGEIRSIKLGHSRLVPVTELRRWIAEQLEGDGDFFGGDAA